MILDLLEPQLLAAGANVLVGLLDEEIQSMKRGDSESRVAAEKNTVSASDGERARAEVENWRKKEVERLVGIPQSDRPPIRIPRDPIGSLLIASFDDFFERSGLTVEDTARGFAKDEVPISSTMLTDEARAFLSDQSRRRFWPKFGQRDARFLTWGAAAVVSTWVKGGPRHFPTQSPKVVQVSERARLILVGDWGSGISRAEKVGTAMRVHVEESQRNGQECHVIHLGDVYYCGWEREYRRRLLASGMWPVQPEEKDTVGSWCLNGNHDMYSGGEGYFDYLLSDTRFWRQSGLSCFMLENRHWQIAGIDTAYADSDIHGPQVAWLSGLRHKAPGKKGLLLSHHQLLSKYEDCSPSVRDRIQPLLDEEMIRAWFWGHEHLCAAYARQHGVEYPRVVGHGGVPVYAWAGHPPDGVIWEAPDAFADSRTGWLFARFGFAVLDFQGDGTILVRYINENGVTQNTESMS